MKPKHRSWADLPDEEFDATSYGNHPWGFGIYRFDPNTYETLEAWLDWECVRDSEVEIYRQYLIDRDFDTSDCDSFLKREKSNE